MKNTYEIFLAMSPRAYGIISVQADDPDTAMNGVTAEFVSENFQPNGGSDDIDYAHPCDIYLMGIKDEDGEDITSGEVQDRDVPDGEWITRKAEKSTLFLMVIDGENDTSVEHFYTSEERDVAAMEWCKDCADELEVNISKATNWREAYEMIDGSLMAHIVMSEITVDCSKLKD